MRLFTLTAAAMALGAAPAHAEDEITFVTNWGSDVYSSAYMIAWAEEFNETYDGVAEIRFVGGPEVTPAREQLTAVRNGVFDMMFGAAGYYVGQVPEAYVLYASDMTPMEARESGAFDLLADIYRERADVEILGWVAAGVGYNIWLNTDEVPIGEDGMPDLSGLKIRSSPFYNAWLETMGATVIPVPAPDIYSALERGVVDGAAWPGLGVTDFGWHEFIDFRIDPPVWQFDNLLFVNLEAWEALSPETQEALRASVIELETAAYDYYAQLAAEEVAEVEAGGTISFTP
ncbi:MAG: TRAP transporter substrate-binding protein DctP, partial [Pseudomonadota bacterium]